MDKTQELSFKVLSQKSWQICCSSFLNGQNRFVTGYLSEKPSDRIS